MKTRIEIEQITVAGRQIGLALLVLLGMAGCKKDNPSGQAPAMDGSTIKFVLNDNFNFSTASAGLQYCNMADLLGKSGPYTFLASDNGAFALMGVSTAATFKYFGNNALVQNIMRYSILDGQISFKKLPLTQNKAFLTYTGGNVYVSKYLVGNDTVVTVNGLRLKSADNRASNGFIQVLPQVMNPEIYRKAMDYIHSDTTITLFAAALQRAKIDVSLLSGSDAYTLLAPSNSAFQQSAKLGKNLGLSTLDSILVADPLQLKTFLNYHILKGRYFEGDLYNYASTNPAGITMLNGANVLIGGTPTGFHAITFLGSGNQGNPSSIATPTEYKPTVNNANIPCGNGVIHIINQVLIP
eukprot:gene2879-3305_t